MIYYYLWYTSNSAMATKLSAEEFKAKFYHLDHPLVAHRKALGETFVSLSEMEHQIQTGLSLASSTAASSAILPWADMQKVTEEYIKSGYDPGKSYTTIFPVSAGPSPTSYIYGPFFDKESLVKKPL